MSKIEKGPEVTLVFKFGRRDPQVSIGLRIVKKLTAAHRSDLLTIASPDVYLLHCIIS